MSTDDVYLGRDDRPSGLNQIASGKVRDIYELDAERLLFVTTDRVSAFDVVMNEGVPLKGAVLTAVSSYWFEKTSGLVRNHLLSTAVEDVPGLDDAWRERLRGRIMIVERCEPTTVEWVWRAYLAGSGWKQYQQSQSVCGVKLPAGLKLASRFDEPIFTPTTKEGTHDRPISADEARARVGDEVFDAAHAASRELFDFGTQELERIGFLLADTKFEFGVKDGEVILIDEALTPDSSRFWPREAWQPGSEPKAYDKQVLRSWLETLDWNKEYPAPTVDPGILRQVTERYLDICERITGSAPAGVAS